MRAQNLRSYGCQTVLIAAVTVAAAFLFAGCSGSGANLKIVTPYGVYDTTTTGTTTLDTRPLFGELPPPIDYSLYGTQTLEK